MRNQLLAIDMPFMCHRARYSTGKLSHSGSATGVIYGVLKQIENLKHTIRTKYTVFCWDSRLSKRAQIYPAYKDNRKDRNKTDQEREEFADFKKQMVCLRMKYLPMMGFKNQLIQPGYEADDIMASLAKNLYSDQRAILVTSDHDLYQTLSPNVYIYNPLRMKYYTLSDFRMQYGIRPDQWSWVKAVAGCSSDNIKGLEGVGEKTAIKYLRNELKPTTKAYQKIRNITQTEAGGEMLSLNMRLVDLPYHGTRRFSPLHPDAFNKKGWEQVCKRLGFRSLKGDFRHG
jgi:DNA polymerase-1